jgi:hypothetical protein
MSKLEKIPPMHMSDTPEAVREYMDAMRRKVPYSEEELAEKAKAIKAKISKNIFDIMEIGRDLLMVKVVTEHGRFTRFVEEQIGYPISTAEDYMATARLPKTATVAILPRKILYRLGRLPEVERGEILKRAADMATGAEAIASVRAALAARKAPATTATPDVIAPTVASEAASVTPTPQMDTLAPEAPKDGEIIPPGGDPVREARAKADAAALAAKAERRAAGIARASATRIANTDKRREEAAREQEKADARLQEAHRRVVAIIPEELAAEVNEAMDDCHGYTIVQSFEDAFYERYPHRRSEDEDEDATEGEPKKCGQCDGTDEPLIQVGDEWLHPECKGLRESRPHLARKPNGKDQEAT